MRFLIQRVSRAGVVVEEETVGKIGKGFFVLIGVEKKITGRSRIKWYRN